MQPTDSNLLNQLQRVMQGVLSPTLEEQLGPLSDKHQKLGGILQLVTRVCLRRLRRSRLRVVLFIFVEQPG